MLAYLRRRVYMECTLNEVKHETIKAKTEHSKSVGFTNRKPSRLFRKR
jgi:hypothetical protein